MFGIIFMSLSTNGRSEQRKTNSTRKAKILHNH